MGSACAPYSTVPDVLGTYPQTDVMFLCGYYMYAQLPPGWVGRCAAVEPTDHSFIVSAMPHPGELPGEQRMRRDVSQPHDPVWCSNVPEDHKLWSTGEKVMLSLFPSLGVGKVMLRMETMNYRFSGFVNTTLVMWQAEREELRGLRAVALQNRIVLDQLTAATGGVCALVGASCCTYIPANDDEGGVIQQAIANLTSLRDAVDHDSKFDRSWFVTGPWYAVCLKLLAPVTPFLILIFVSVCCIIPIIKALVKKSVAVVMHQEARYQEQLLLLDL